MRFSVWLKAPVLLYVYVKYVHGINSILGCIAPNPNIFKDFSVSDHVRHALVGGRLQNGSRVGSLRMLQKKDPWVNR